MWRTVFFITADIVRFLQDDNGSYQKSLQSIKFKIATARQLIINYRKKNTSNSILIALFFT